MAARKSKRLVIDASVARAAGGEDASHPTSKHCRDFLEAIRRICHQIVITPEIGEEWKRHQSKFARQWLVSMTAKKKARRLGNVTDNGLRDKVERSIVEMKENDREAIRKDFRLIEAAIATDRIVISLDETARALFAAAVRSVGKLKNIVWVNPSRPGEELILWLANGAKPEKRRLLGFRI